MSGLLVYNSSMEGNGRSYDELVQLVWDWFEERNLQDPTMQLVKVNEEIGEICHEVSRGRFDSVALVDALGDSFVTLIGMCHHLGINPKTALEEAYNEIKDRRGKVVNGSFVKEGE